MTENSPDTSHNTDMTETECIMTDNIERVKCSLLV
jgi:hypothetical protein